MPVIKTDSSEAKNTQSDATSPASHKRPRGTLDKDLDRLSGVSGTPAKDSNLEFDQSSEEPRSSR